MNLTRSQIKGLVPVLRALSGPAEKPYVYDEKTRYAVAKNLVLLSRLDSETDKHRIESIRAVYPDGKPTPGTPEHKALESALEEYIKSEVQVPNLIALTMDPFVKAGTPFDLIEGLEPLLTGVE